MSSSFPTKSAEHLVTVSAIIRRMSQEWMNGTDGRVELRLVPIFDHTFTAESGLRILICQSFDPVLAVKLAVIHAPDDGPAYPVQWWLPIAPGDKKLCLTPADLSHDLGALLSGPIGRVALSTLLDNIGS